LLRAGAGDLNRDALSMELESRGISVNVASGSDTTSVSGSSTTLQLERGFELTRLVLLKPTFPADEFRKMQEQTVNSLSLRREDARFVASRDLSAALFGDTPLGTAPTPESVASITLEDVKGFYKTYFRPRDAILMISGDVSVERGRELAKKLLDGWTAGDATLPEVNYKLPPAANNRRIILVDRPGAKQSVINMGIRGYDIHTDEKFAGSLASMILSSGIESRLNKYVRAEKGLTYGVSGRFSPGRHAGVFTGATDTAVESTADTVEAMFKVFEDMRKAEVTPVELAEAKTRVAGGMVMGMQTIGQQAGYRVDAILNDYPIDYYDTYPQKIDAVTAAQVREVMNKYVKDGEMVIVVVAPADAVKDQLKRVGEVEVVPMPAKREGAKDLGKNELLRKAA
jgi:predicted Zn-dependent peptidase